jgi:hypothetical protein
VKLAVAAHRLSFYQAEKLVALVNDFPVEEKDWAFQKEANRHFLEAKPSYLLVPLSVALVVYEKEIFCNRANPLVA